MRPIWYAPDGTPIDIAAAESYLADADARRVALTRVGMWEVSTVFLVLDHNLGAGGPPVLWESMLFCHDDSSGLRNMLDLDCRRYVSREAAELGHEELVRELRASLAELHELDREVDRES